MSHQAQEELDAEHVDTASDAEDVTTACSGFASSTTFKCDHCGTLFGRHEHLVRHKRTHTGEKPFPCSTCGKSFSRPDVLTRHAAAHAELGSNFRRGGSFTRACQACASSRSRCSKDYPCRRCKERGLECRYTTARRRSARMPAAHVQDDIAEAGSQDREGSQGDVGVIGRTQPPPDETRDTTFVQSNAATIGLPIGDPWNMPHIDESRTENLQMDLAYDPQIADHFLPSPLFADQSTGISAINWLTPQYYTESNWGALPSLSNANPIGSFPPASTGAQNFTTDRLPQRLPLPMINIMPVDPPQATPHPSYTSPRDQISHGTTISENMIEGSTTGSVESSSTTVTLYYVDGAPARAPTARSLAIKATGGAEGSQAADLLSVQAYENLVARMKNEPYLRGSELDASSPIPSLPDTRTYCRRYVQRFHLAYPFLQTSLLSQLAQWPLLLAVCAIGSTLCPGEGDARCRELLFTLLEALVCFYTSENDTGGVASVLSISSVGPVLNNETSLVAVQVVMLYLICKVHNAKPGKYGLVHVARHFLFDVCRRWKLLGKQERPLPLSHTSPEAEEVVPRRSQMESRVRTGLMIWLLDYIMFLERDEEPLFKLGDAQCVLPGSDMLWDKPSAGKTTQQWSKGTTVPEALEMLYMQKRLPPDLGDFSTTVLIYAICRRTREALYQSQSQLNAWVPTAAEVPQQRSSSVDTVEETWPPSLPIQSRWRNSACDCLDLLHWSANAAVARAGGWEHPVVLHLHLSRLALLAPVRQMRILVVAAAAAAEAQGCPPPDAAARIDEARTHVARWALHDRYKARLAVVHAGAVLWHVRRYSVDDFVEPFCVFTAVLVVWAYSTMMIFWERSRRASRSPTLSSRDGQGGGGGPARVLSPSREEIGGDAVAETPTAEQMEDEEPEPDFLHLDRPCDDEMVQMYVRLGHRMSGHMARVGDICKEGAPLKIIEEGIRMLGGRTRRKSDVEKGRQIWGIEPSYSRLLGFLAQSCKGTG